jgi:hypothetical protein
VPRVEPGRQRGRVTWSLAVLGLTAALAVLQAVDGPTVLRQALAAALSVLMTLGLTLRSGANAPLGTLFALLVGVVAVATQWDTLLAGAAVGAAVVAACLAVMGTRPAPGFARVVLEVVLALAVANAGGLAAAGFAANLDTERFDYTVLGLSVLSVVALVYRLGGGLHGLGRRGAMLATGALVLLVVVLVYAAAFTEYGSPELVRQGRSVQGWVREHLGGAPHPVEVLVGIPALAWGVAMRSRRRQGWWACAFGAAATAHVASDLIDRNDTVLGAVLTACYGLVLGLALGAVLIRLERVLTGRDGGRPAAVGQEPPRMQPLH